MELPKYFKWGPPAYQLARTAVMYTAGKVAFKQNTLTKTITKK